MTVEHVPSDADMVLQKLSVAVDTPRLQHRLEVLEATIDFIGARVSSEAEVLSKPQTRHLVRLLLGALINPQYLERSWMRSILNAVGLATKSKRCPIFTGICSTNLAGECKRSQRCRSTKPSLLYLLKYYTRDQLITYHIQYSYITQHIINNSTRTAPTT